MPQVFEKNGAGEGNRTLVISLEGIGASRDTNAYSDIYKLSDHFETKPSIRAVRTSASALRILINMPFALDGTEGETIVEATLSDKFQLVLGKDRYNHD